MILAFFLGFWAGICTEYFQGLLVADKLAQKHDGQLTEEFQRDNGATAMSHN